MAAFLVMVFGPGALPAQAQSSPSSITFTVDTEDDDASATACTTSADDDCSLRGAIIKANTTAEADVIDVPAGTYTLTIPEADPKDATVGDLDITGPTTINGAGARTTIVQGGAAPFNDRIFENSATTTISGLTVTGGKAAGLSGGGILNNNNALTLDEVAVSANTAADVGGVFGIGGTLTITDSTVSGNSARQNAEGIGQADGTANITNSTISGNQAAGFSGGVAMQGAGTMNIQSSTIAFNTSTQPGGGILTSAAGGTPTVNVKNTIVSNNTTTNCSTTAPLDGTITSQATT